MKILFKLFQTYVENIGVISVVGPDLKYLSYSMNANSKDLVDPLNDASKIRQVSNS